MSLSPGKWHELVPRDPEANIEWRNTILADCEESQELREAIWLICSQDIIFYIDTFCWQYNPFHPGDEVGPFICWPFQERALFEEPTLERPDRAGILWCMEHLEDLIIQKSREMGATVLLMMVGDWWSRFHSNKHTHVISRSADAVESKNSDSLFWKLDFIQEHLPWWLKEPMLRQKMHFEYQKTDSQFTGEASTGRAGVGGRAIPMLLDEFSQVKEDYEVVFRTARTALCRIFIGTHLGTNTAFYELSKSKSIKKLFFHWTQHPEKNEGLYRWNQAQYKIEFLEYRPETDDIVEIDGPKYAYPPDFSFDMTGRPTGGPHPGVRSPWYDKEFRRITESEVEMAKDQDINPTGSVSQFYSPLLIRELKEHCRAPDWQGDLVHDKQTGKPIEWVKSNTGLVKLWFHMRDGKPPPGKYGIGVDVSAGTGATMSCISVKNGRTGEKVLEYQCSRIDPKDLGALAVALGWSFVDEDGIGAKIGWENHGPGVVFGLQVWKRLGYGNLYYRTAEFDRKEKVSQQPGWTPTPNNKRVLHEKYKRALFERTFVNLSKTALDETLEFKHTLNGGVEHAGYANTDPSAARENHGDIVVADALAEKMCEGIDLETVKKAKEIEHSLMTALGRRELAKTKEKDKAWA